MPDDGGWICFDHEGVTRCDGGSDVPDGGDWECETRDGNVSCTDTTPEYPDGGGGGDWSCHYTREFRACDGGDGECMPGDPDCTPGNFCVEERRGSVTFDDSLDGDPDGELGVLGNDPRRAEACAILRVTETAYYALYDDALAESCAEQQDEIGYVTITNSCNAGGDPVERNASEHYIVADVDNSPPCSSDAECGSGNSCITRSAHVGPCCVPTDPVLVGTFLLVAGEDNRVCLHHACPEIRAGTLTGAEAFVTAGCKSSTDSVHLRLDGSAFVCPDPTIEFPMTCGG